MVWKSGRTRSPRSLINRVLPIVTIPGLWTHIFGSGAATVPVLR